MIKHNDYLPDNLIHAFQQIISIVGCLVIQNSRATHISLEELVSIEPNQDLCEYTFALLIFNNPNLKEITFKQNFRFDKSSILIRANPILTSVKGIKVDYGGPTDCTVSTSSSVRKCKVVVGDVKIDHLSSKGFENIEEVIGTIRIEHSNVPYLNALDSLKLVGWKRPALIISHNDRLVDISSLLTMDIKSKAPAIEIKGNPSICHNVVERNKIREWLEKKGSSVEFTDRCQIPNNIAKLEQVEKIDGRVFVTSNDALQKLHFFKNIKEISGGRVPAGFKGDRRRLIIQGNRNLVEIQFNEQLHLGSFEAFIKLNPKLKYSNIKGATFSYDLGDEKDCLAIPRRFNHNCRRMLGDVHYDSYDPKIWKRMEGIEGPLYVRRTNLKDLNFLKNLKINSYISPALTIEDNENLVDISGLLTSHITSYPPILSIYNNSRICHNIAERKQLEVFLRKVNARVKFVKDCLLSCPGGKVSKYYLARFDKHCNVVKGNLIISELYELPKDINKLEQVEIINGRLIVTNNRAVKDLSFLKNLREINNPELDKPGLVVENNRNFKNKGLSSLVKVTGGEAKATAAPNTGVISTKKRASTSRMREETTTAVTTRELLTVIITPEPPEKSRDSDEKGNQEPASTDATMPKLRNVKLSRNVENALIAIEQALLRKERMQKLVKEKGPAVYEGLFWLAMFILVLCIILAAIGVESFFNHRKKKNNPKRR